MEAWQALRSVGLVILPGLLLGPILGESLGDVEEEKPLAFPFPCTKKALPRPKDNARWHSKQVMAQGSRALDIWPLHRGPPELSWQQLSHFWIHMFHQGGDKTTLWSRAARKSTGHPVKFQF